LSRLATSCAFHLFLFFPIFVLVFVPAFVSPMDADLVGLDFAEDAFLLDIQSQKLFMIYPNAADSQISQDHTSVIGTALSSSLPELWPKARSLLHLPFAPFLPYAYLCFCLVH
jgi:hypothetical protein